MCNITSTPNCSKHSTKYKQYKVTCNRSTMRSRAKSMLRRQHKPRDLTAWLRTAGSVFWMPGKIYHTASINICQQERPANLHGSVDKHSINFGRWMTHQIFLRNTTYKNRCCSHFSLSNVSSMTSPFIISWNIHHQLWTIINMSSKNINSLVIRIWLQMTYFSLGLKINHS